MACCGVPLQQELLVEYWKNLAGTALQHEVPL